MSVRRDRRYGHWLYRKQIRTSDGRTVRIFGVPTKIGLPDTRTGAEQAERLHLDRVLKTGEVTQTPPPPKEVPKVRASSSTSISQRSAAAIGQYRNALLVTRSGRSKNRRWQQRRVIR
jgi:hypothetical protein